jgi:hypothetical protein
MGRCCEIEHMPKKRLVIKSLTPAAELARRLIACRPVPPQGGEFLRGFKAVVAAQASQHAWATGDHIT